MACPSQPVRTGLDPQLAAAFSGHPHLLEDCRIEINEDQMWVLFPESDFVVRTRPVEGSDHAVRLKFSVAVRAPEPSLETWWDKWSVTTDRDNQVAVVRREILAGRREILQMLEDRFDVRSSVANSVSIGD
ncbi:hypothetical protein LQ384_20530 [Rhodococcus rhodochrous]|uniref:Uncharacterized protein n=2 Tax=Rhodococcus TaxID=1827 RepID=A0AAW4XKR9_RHORH|nr:hypothetical protein [Rhodococcus rhodochrous]MCD2113501.1 hypothetical protein [Rhodococcus rhodochrous]